MKVCNLDERVHVLDPHTSVWSVIREIAESGVQEDAFYVCDVGDIVRKHKLWKNAMPRVEPFYAVKCNDSLTVLEVLAALGTGFDCASKSEINKILSLGVSPDKIVFANPAKPSSHIRHAATTGVDLMTFDNNTELHKIKNLYPNARLLLRIRCDASVAQCPLGMKFGCNPITEAPELLKTAQSLDLNIVGVSFHVGSGCKDPPVFRKAIATCSKIFELAEMYGYKMNLLDLGGGYPGDHGTSIDNIAEIINAALDDYFPDSSVKIIAEPGRFYVSSAYTLATNVHSVRTVASEDKVTGGKSLHNMYFINDGIYGSFNCVLYDHQVVVPQPLKDYTNSTLYSSSIWGPTCDGLDQVIENILLPELKLGDWLIFENMGAYTLPVASPFNGFPIPKVHIVADEDICMMLKDTLLLTEEHFVMGNNVHHPNMKFNSLELDTTNGWTIPNMPLTISLCTNGSIIQEHVFDYVSTID